MARTEETRTINGLEVTTIKLPSMRGSQLRFRLIRLLAPAGPALGAVFTGKKLSDLGAVDVISILPALPALFAQLDDATHDALLCQILVCTSVVADGPKGKVKYDLTSKAFIEQAFSDDVDALWAAARFALEVNLSGFFTGQAAPGIEIAAAPSV